MPHIPLKSVTALAAFELDPAGQTRAQAALKAEANGALWLNHIELHGLSGFAQKHLSEHELSAPPNIAMPLRALNLRHKAAAAARAKMLAEIADAFAAQQIDWLALKGVALTSRLYGAPELRPMRDMDLLLPEHQLTHAANVLRELGFDIPNQQPSRFMRDSHQLPNASKVVDGFTISVELHKDAIPRDVSGRLKYPTDPHDVQVIDADGLAIPMLSDDLMLHQVCRHYVGLHDGAVLKLINAMDVIGMANLLAQQGSLRSSIDRFAHIENVLRCLHLINPLPIQVQQIIPNLAEPKLAGVGQSMVPLKNIWRAKQSDQSSLKLLLSPPEWWLHLYYNVAPTAGLTWVRFFRHPMNIATWLMRRAYSALQGG